MADGAYVSGLSVTDGKLEIPQAASTVHVGLPYEQLIHTLPLHASLPGTGSTMGRKQQIGEVAIKVVNTRGIKAGVSESDLFEVKPRSFEAYGDAPELFTGEYTVHVPAKWSGDAGVIIKQTLPLPMTITGVYPEIVLGG
jgi:hypothetical protein